MMVKNQEYPIKTNILDRIVQSKREEVSARRSEISLDDMRKRAQDSAPPRDFYQAITRQGRMRLIAEIKKASPSKGLIQPDFNPEAIAQAYVLGGADALSVLTDAPFFQGSIEIFRQVRATVDLPMLRKDFMIDPYQFYEARAIGADAVLLITSILSSIELKEFYDLAGSLGMTVLVETHSEKDIERAMAILNPRLLGINNRDLHDSVMRTDIQHTSRMIPAVRNAAQDGACPAMVSESGIHTASDVSFLKSLGISAILVGESLMRQPDPGKAIQDLMDKA